jgi:hypothetical protein
VLLSVGIPILPCEAAKVPFLNPVVSALVCAPGILAKGATRRQGPPQI